MKIKRLSSILSLPKNSNTHCLRQGSQKNTQGDKEGQREITVDEKFEFDHMLGQVNMLYLGCQVLLLLDLSYLTRFWTMYEAWLSHLQPTTQGLQLAQGDAANRCHIMPILGTSEGFKLALVDQIAAKMAPESAAAFLKNVDVSVTNASDKVKQLAKVSGLDERVRNVMVRNAAIVKVHDATRAEPVDTAALKSAVDQAQAVGVEDEKLEEARRALRASADRQAISQEEIRRAEVRFLQDALEDQRGATLRVMMLAGASATVARASGYSVHELKAAGYVEGYKAAGYTCMEAKKAGFLPSEVARAGFGADEAKAAGFIRTIEEAKAVGCVEGLRAAGFTFQESRLVGYTMEEARQAGYMCWEVQQAGYTWEEARQTGYTLKESRQAGYTLVEARQSGYALEEARQACYTCAEARLAKVLVID